MSLSNIATNVISAPSPAGANSTEELLVALTRKVDALSNQVGQLHARAQATDDLKEELVRIARDATGALQVELSSIEHEVNTEEIVHLLRQLLRSTPRFIRLLERLEGLDALADELGPLSKEVVRDLVERLQLWDERGYFELAQSGLQVLERLAEHSSNNDLSWLADSVEPLLETVKLAAQPNVLALAQGALGAVSRSATEPPPQVGLWGLARASRDPDVRRGMGILVAALRQLGAAAAREDAAFGAADSDPPLLQGNREQQGNKE